MPHFKDRKEGRKGLRSLTLASTEPGSVLRQSGSGMFFHTQAGLFGHPHTQARNPSRLAATARPAASVLSRWSRRRPHQHDAAGLRASTYFRGAHVLRHKLPPTLNDDPMPKELGRGRLYDVAQEIPGHGARAGLTERGESHVV